MDFWAFMLDRQDEILASLTRHIWLTGVAVAIATGIGVSLGMLMTRAETFASPVLGIASVIQTVPSIALLGLMIPLFGIGVKPAIVALFLYALLPILRNTYTGIKEVDPSLIAAAVGMGMTGRQLLLLVQLPLAMPITMAGIRTATVISVGIATLAAPIGAGGLGDQIFQGIATVNNNLIFAGALPAALLALVLDGILGLLEKRLSPGHTSRAQQPV